MNKQTALWSREAAVLATNGRSWGADWHAENIAIDSRKIRPGDLFVALIGDNFDGHDFLQAAYDAGAVAAVVSRLPEEIPSALPVIEVFDTLVALTALAEAARTRLSAPVIAVTGSVGKTGSKEGLAHVLAEFGACHVSEGNFNNHIGAPLSLARAPKDSDFCVLEMGMNHAGEIAPLSRLARPDIAIITNVEAVHIGHFESLQAIAAAKCEIFEGLSSAGIVVLNRDDTMFHFCAAAAKARGISTIITFGRDAAADIHLLKCQSDASGSAVTVAIGSDELSFALNAVGTHWVNNSLGILAVVHALGLDTQKAAKALTPLTASRGRGGRVEISLPDGNFLLLDESYNASPPAMRAALAVLAMTPVGHEGRRIAVLGDMLELGDHAPKLHADLAADVFASGADLLFTVGAQTPFLRAALTVPIAGHHRHTAAEIAADIAAIIRAGDVVLVKGSLGVGMKAVITALTDLDIAVTHGNSVGGRG